MPITVRHTPSAALIGEIGRRTGYGRGRYQEELRERKLMSRAADRRLEAYLAGLREQGATRRAMLGERAATERALMGEIGLLGRQALRQRAVEEARQWQYPAPGSEEAARRLGWEAQQEQARQEMEARERRRLAEEEISEILRQEREVQKLHQSGALTDAQAQEAARQLQERRLGVQIPALQDALTETTELPGFERRGPGLWEDEEGGLYTLNQHGRLEQLKQAPPRPMTYRTSDGEVGLALPNAYQPLQRPESEPSPEVQQYERLKDMAKLRFEFEGMKADMLKPLYAAQAKAENEEAIARLHQHIDEVRSMSFGAFMGDLGLTEAPEPAAPEQPAALPAAPEAGELALMAPNGDIMAVDWAVIERAFEGLQDPQYRERFGRIVQAAQDGVASAQADLLGILEEAGML